MELLQRACRNVVRASMAPESLEDRRLLTLLIDLTAYEGTGTDVHDVALGDGAQDHFMSGELSWTAARTGAPDPHAINFPGTDTAPPTALGSPVDLSQIVGRTTTVAFWLRTTATGNDNPLNTGAVLGTAEGGADNQIFMGYLDAQGRMAFTLGGAGAATVRSTSPVNDGNWYHIAMSRDLGTGQMKIYVNGIPNATANGPTTERTAAAIIDIGAVRPVDPTTQPTRFFNGQLDEIKIYDEALSDTAVGSLFDPSGTAPGTPTNLAATYSGARAVQVTWTDAAGNESFYEVQTSIDGGATWVDAGRLLPGISSAYVTGLQPSTNYSIRIRGVNPFGASAYSAPVAATTSAVAPLSNGTGVTGFYYDDGGDAALATNYTGRFVTRHDSQINFNWGTGVPHPAIFPDNFSVRWLGQVQAQYNEPYTFYLRSDDGGEIWVNGVQVLNDPTFHGIQAAPGLASATVNMVAGQKYDIEVRMFEGGGGAGALFGWSSPSTPYQIVPRQQLFPRPVTGTAPAAPSEGSAFAVNPYQIDVTWGDNSDNEHGFKILRSRTGAAGTFHEIARVSNSTTYSDLVLPGSTFHYQVVAFNDGGDSAAVAAGNASTAADGRSGPGVSARYWNNQAPVPNHQGAPNVVTVEPNLDAATNWAAGSPAGINPDNFSWRFTGKVTAPATGTYRFVTNTDDGAFLWVNGVQVTNDPTYHGPFDRLADITIDLVEGQSYNFVFDGFEGGGGAQGRMRWILPGQASVTVIPATAFTAAMDAPAAATAGTHVATSNQVLVRWNDLSTSEINYFLERATNAAFTDAKEIAVLPINSTSFVDSGLTPGTTYYYRIRGGNYDVMGAYGDLGSAATLATEPAPAAPTNLTAVGRIGPRVVLNWTDAAINETEYQVRRRQGTTGTFETIALLNPGSTSYNDTGLLPNTEYSYEVVAVNAVGEGVATATAITGPVAGPGYAATYYDNIDFTGTTVTRTEQNIGVDWGGGAPIAGIGADTFSVRWEGQLYVEFTGNYVFFSDTDDGGRLFINDQPVINAWFDQGRGTYENSNALFPTGVPLEAGRLYNFRFEMYENGGGAGAFLEWQGPNTPRQQVPGANIFNNPPTGGPSNLTAANLPTGRVGVTWTDGSEFEAGTIIERSETGPAGPFTEVTRLLTTGTGYLDSAVTPGSTYHYRVRAFNAFGQTPNSNVASVTVVAGNPGTGLDATAYETRFFQDDPADPDDPLHLPGLDLDENLGANPIPGTTIDAETFSVVWEGQFQAEFTETYTFFTASDDGIGMTIIDPETNTVLMHFDGVNFLRGMPGAGFQDTAGTAALTAGKKYDVQLRFTENGGGAGWRFGYQSPSTPQQIIPNTVLFPPTAGTPRGVDQVVARGIGDAVSILWRDLSINETGFEILRSTSPDSDFAVVGTANANGFRFDDSGLTIGTTYYYKVRTLGTPANAPDSDVVSYTPTVIPWFSFPTFPNTNGLALNGTATVIGNRLRLTDNVNDQTGSAYQQVPIDTTNFKTSFTFQVTNSNGADGFTWVVQRAGATAIGGGGGSLGYQGMPTAVALKYDFYNNIDQTGLYINGAMDDAGQDLRANGINLDGGTVYKVDITYANGVLTQTITDTDNPANTFTANYNVDIPATIGGTSGLIGFTGATGGLNARMEIVSWTFGDPPQEVVIDGDEADEVLYMRKNGANIDLFLNDTGTGTPYQSVPATIALRINGNEGNDLLIIDQSGGDINFASLTGDLGPGMDTLRVLNATGNVNAGIGVMTIGGTTLNHVSADVQQVNGILIGLSVAGGQTVQLAGDNTTTTVQSVTLGTGSMLDLRNNDLKVTGGDVAAIEALVRSARNGATRWQGPGIGTTAATAPSTGLAVATVAGDVIVKFSYDGDANVDGLINADDYFRIDSGFLEQPETPTYAQGDFNFDDTINADDYFLIDSAFLGQGTPLASASAAVASTASAAAESVIPDNDGTKKARRVANDNSALFSSRRIEKRSARRGR